jgi:hypothetical protein
MGLRVYALCERSTFLLLVYFNTLVVSQTVASKGRINVEQWIGKDWEGSDRGIIEIALLSRNLPEGSEENQENPVRIARLLAEIRTEYPPNTNTTFSAQIKYEDSSSTSYICVHHEVMGSSGLDTGQNYITLTKVWCSFSTRHRETHTLGNVTKRAEERKHTDINSPLYVYSLYRYNVKGKIVSVLNKLSSTPWRRMGEWMYRSSFSWPRHYLEQSGQLHAPGKEPRYPFDWRLGRPQIWSRRRGEEKILDPTGTRTSTSWSSSL